MFSSPISVLRHGLSICILTGLSATVFGQTVVEIDADADVKVISPYLYGRNNSFSSTDPNWKLPQADLTKYKDAGVQFFRESGGNNSSKYNWRRKLSSHPDWYNNVYHNDWDQAALELQKHFPDAQGMWAFQLLGVAAKTGTNNFADWDYNRSQWWEGVSQNLAGGGVPNTNGPKAQKEGDTKLYLETWTADSSVSIIDHWFGSAGIGLRKDGIRYWSMDNEPEIWSGTHDDVMPKQTTPQDFIDRYIRVAKMARERYPDIKLAGPVTANEWQWYNWDGGPVTENGNVYPWLEYFIKRIAEEQKASGIRLLDVLDIHFYPATKKTEEVVQLHRVFFDRNYNFPEANGVKTSGGGYNNSITKEYIFGRCNDWLAQYMGPAHGVTLGLTETGIDESISPSVTAVWYASTLGEFMKNGVEIFTPWSWKAGMWETLHLFSRYSHALSVKGSSSDEALVSAYPSLNAAKDSMTVIFINRSADQSRSVSVQFNHFNPLNESIPVYTLAQLPMSETFVSHAQNALKSSTILFAGGPLNITLPPMSVSAVRLRSAGEVLGQTESAKEIQVFPNPAWDSVTVKWDRQEFQKMTILDVSGREVFKQYLKKGQRESVAPIRLPQGLHFIRLSGADGNSVVRKIIAR